MENRFGGVTSLVRREPRGPVFRGTSRAPVSPNEQRVLTGPGGVPAKARARGKRRPGGENRERERATSCLSDYSKNKYADANMTRAHPDDL